jgi:MFS family permease
MIAAMIIVSADIFLLFATRIIRLFAYGFISVVLALYLATTELSASGVGAILSATLAGDILVSLSVTMVADRVGRRNMLLFGAALMILAGLVFLLTTNPVWITLAVIIGIVSPSGGEIGPFLSIEQAALSQLVPDNQRTRIFGWYNLAGSFATAPGALAGGWLAQWLQTICWSGLDAYRVIMGGYAGCGLTLMLFFIFLSRHAEVVPVAETVGVQSKEPWACTARKRWYSGSALSLPSMPSPAGSWFRV